MTTIRTDTNTHFGRRSEMQLSLALLAILVILLIPLPPVLLDMLLATNMAITVLLLLVTLRVAQPLELSVFPSLLLLTTLFRLSLNVATTRLILLDGDAGRMVSTFGGFVVGGNLIVGLVIFLILIIVQFIVITKGSSRVSEVAARFTLDAMPGKQMAIDAELNAGAIDQTTATRKREGLAAEAEFYGAMDGASKFVRGDAIAGLVVTGINLVGGIILGVTNGLSFAEAGGRYSVLTVGDGLVSQIPALVIATAAGILVTKSGSKDSLGSEIGKQFAARHQALTTGAVVLAGLALVPGLPKSPFLLIGVGLLIASRGSRAKQQADKAKPKRTEEPTISPDERVLQDFVQDDRVTLEIGAGLVALVKPSGNGLTKRIPTMRKELTKKHGIWVPPIRIRDNLDLDVNTYQIKIAGRVIGQGEVQPHDLLAIDPTDPTVEIAGTRTIEPTFGLPARWIAEESRQRAELAGFTVVDASTVIVTQLGEVLRKHASELLTREDLSKLLGRLKETNPTIVEEIKPDTIRLGRLQAVLQLLLEEQVPLTDLGGVLESAVLHAPQIPSNEALADIVRGEIGRTICDRFRNADGQVRVIVMEPTLESALREMLHEGELALPPVQLERLVESAARPYQQSADEGSETALLVDKTLRRALRKLIRRSLPDLHIIAYTEVPADLLISPTGMIKQIDVMGEQAANSSTFDLAGALAG